MSVTPQDFGERALSAYYSPALIGFLWLHILWWVERSLPNASTEQTIIVTAIVIIGHLLAALFLALLFGIIVAAVRGVVRCQPQ